MPSGRENFVRTQGQTVWPWKLSTCTQTIAAHCVWNMEHHSVSTLKVPALTWSKGCISGKMLTSGSRNENIRGSSRVWHHLSLQFCAIFFFWSPDKVKYATSHSLCLDETTTEARLSFAVFFWRVVWSLKFVSVHYLPLFGLQYVKRVFCLDIVVCCSTSWILLKLGTHFLSPQDFVVMQHLLLSMVFLSVLKIYLEHGCCVMLNCLHPEQRVWQDVEKRKERKNLKK